MMKKALVLENNPSLASLWSSYLCRHGYDAIHYVEAPGGSRPSKDWGFPDVIVSGLDIDRRIPTGSELCLKAFSAKPLHGDAIPVVQLLSSKLSSARMRQLEGAAFKLLVKPTPLPTLLAVVRDAAFEAEISAIRRSASPLFNSSLQGSSLVAALHSIESGRLSGSLIVESPSGRALIHFKDAVFIGASLGSLSGGEALMEAMSWESGSAFFHARDATELPSRPCDGPSIKELVAESLAQKDLLARTGRLLASPSATLQRNPSARLLGRAPFSERIYAALDEPCDLESLFAELKCLTRRQLLVALGGMLERGEIVLSSSPSSTMRLGPLLRRKLAEALRVDDSKEATLTAPSLLAVCATSSNMARCFIGAACGLHCAPYAILSSGRVKLLLAETAEDDLLAAASSSAGALVLFDRFDSDSVSKARLLFSRYLKDGRLPCLFASPLAPDHCGVVPPIELLGLEDPRLHVSFEYTKRSCSSVLAKLLEMDASDS